MLMFLWQFLRKVYKSLLIGLLVSKRVLFNKVKSIRIDFLNDRTIWCLAYNCILSIGKSLSIARLSHLNFYNNGNKLIKNLV